MKPIALIVLIVFAAALTAAAASAVGRSSAPSATRCGGQLWRLKTLSDRQRALVRLTPTQTTIADIAKLGGPRSIPRTRRTAFQRQTWEVPAQVTSYRFESGGLRLILFDDDSYLNAVVPIPTCLTRTARARATMAATWKSVTGCATPARGWQSFGVIAHVSGVGFWSQRRASRGSAANGAELYPVTGVRVVVGC
jgi:hypothetical protein